MPTRIGEYAFPADVVVSVVEQFITPDDTRARRGFGAVCLGLFEERGDVRGRHGVFVQTRLQAVKPECCQHQQHRNERYEQPGHMAK